MSELNKSLCTAVLENNVDAAKFYLHVGADPNSGDGGFFPLMIAARKGYEEMAITLLKAGADINLADPWGNTAEIWSVHFGHTKLSKILKGEYKK